MSLSTITPLQELSKITLLPSVLTYLPAFLLGTVYKEKDIKIRYAQAVEKIGVETDKIKFMKTNPITAVCIYHKGSYENLRNSYEILLKYIEENDYEIIDNVRECYIDGCWNKENPDDYLTEIQFPVIKKN